MGILDSLLIEHMVFQLEPIVWHADEEEKGGQKSKDSVKPGKDFGSFRFLAPCLLGGILVLILSGCALVKPNRHYEESTPIDWGLANTFESSASVVPFVAEDSKWGVYAAQRMEEYLLEEKAFRKIAFLDEGDPKPAYVITGTLEHLSYGGPYDPTSVFLTVRVIDTADGQIRFMRTARASSEKRGYHMTLLRRVYVPSPYPEEVMNGILKHIAQDIASRSRSPAKQGS